MKSVIPNPALGSLYIGSLIADSKRPNAGLVLLDYLMSVRGQTVWNGYRISASPLPNIAGSLDPRGMNPFDATPYTPEVMKASLEKWNKLFRN